MNIDSIKNGYVLDHIEAGKSMQIYEYLNLADLDCSVAIIKNVNSKKDGRKMIEELYDKQFTYEWLSKNDPHNSIMGLFCSCCGTITSWAYGKDIARSSVIAPDVQNLVVRNSKGDIISKGTMYVNKEKGYAVINDFELNEKYRHHESSSGRYMHTIN